MELQKTIAISIAISIPMKADPISCFELLFCLNKYLAHAWGASSKSTSWGVDVYSSGGD